MPTVRESRKFVAEDGTEFDTKAEAQRYEKLRAAQSDYERAASLWNRALAESFKTGDGQPFEAGVSYYCVFERYAEEGMTWESFYPDSFKIEDDHRPALIRSRYNSQRNYELETTRFYFDLMFRDKRDAQRKVLEIKRQRLGWLQESVAELEKELGIKSSVD